MFNKATAYAVLVIDSETRITKGIGIFSERYPTFGADLLFVVHESTGSDFQDAYDKCKEWCENDYAASKLLVER